MARDLQAPCAAAVAPDGGHSSVAAALRFCYRFFVGGESASAPCQLHGVPCLGTACGVDFDAPRQVEVAGRYGMSRRPPFGIDERHRVCVALDAEGMGMNVMRNDDSNGVHLIGVRAWAMRGPRVWPAHGSQALTPCDGALHDELYVGIHDACFS